MKHTLENIIKVMEKIIHEKPEIIEHSGSNDRMTIVLNEKYSYFIKGIYASLISIKEMSNNFEFTTEELLFNIPVEWEKYFNIIDPEYNEYIRLKEKFEN